MKRIALAAFAVATVTLNTACESPTHPRDLSEVRVTAVVAAPPITVPVVGAPAPNTPPPLFSNPPIENGAPRATTRIPPGGGRTIPARPYDSDGDLPHGGSKTIDVRRGQTPPVSIP